MKKKKTKQYTVTQYATKTGIARQNVLKKIWKKQLTATKIGEQWIITA